MGMNHLEDKGQETSAPLYPLPPPLGVVFLPHITTGGIWGYLLVVWGYGYCLLVVATYPIYCYYWGVFIFL